MLRETRHGAGRTAESGAVEQAAFTLIEMLVVIAIIAVLVGLLLPAIGKARQFAKRTRARTELRQIEIAWKSYYNDYREFPSSGINEMSGTAIDIMNGDNPRHTRYMEFDADATEFLDPWGGIYQVVLDRDYDNRVSPLDYSGVTLDRTVAAWSYGVDGEAGKRYPAGDDILSWK